MSKGFFTDTTLCIGCKACEVACKQWNQLPADGYEFSGNSYDNTMALGATTWRHVAFIEQTAAPEAPPSLNKWLMMSDVCKHCTYAGCMEACPTGAIDAPSVSQDRHAPRGNGSASWSKLPNNRLPGGRRGAHLLFKLTERGVARIFISFIFALRYRPCSSVFLCPERSAHVRDEHFEANAIGEPIEE